MEPFHFKDCTLTAIATGFKAQTLTQLRDGIAKVPTGSLYFHFWGGRLRTAYEYREYHSDFAQWSHRYLNDDILAERLDLIDPTDYENFAKTRDDLLALIDYRLQEIDYIPTAKHHELFHFVSSKIVVFPTKVKASTLKELKEHISKMTNSSLFFHFIDAAQRTSDGKDDFSTWLKQFGDEHKELIAKLHAIDPYFISLPDLRTKVEEIF